MIGTVENQVIVTDDMRLMSRKSLAVGNITNGGVQPAFDQMDVWGITSMERAYRFKNRMALSTLVWPTFGVPCRI